MKNKKLIWYVLAVISSLCLVCVVAVIAIESGPSKTKAERYAEEYNGSVDAYNDIFNSNDCDFLQSSFDRSYETTQSAPGTIHSQRAIGFMEASDERMKEIGCYK
jgi:hypothetical protein